MPTTTLTATYAMHPHTFPPCISNSASFENVEKVVNPPQKPTVSNRVQWFPSPDSLLKAPQSKPIRKHPSRFTVSVPQGKPFADPFIANETRYRAIPPKKLPVPTATIFFTKSEIIDKPSFVFLLQRYGSCSFLESKTRKKCVSASSFMSSFPYA